MYRHVHVRTSPALLKEWLIYVQYRDALPNSLVISELWEGVRDRFQNLATIVSHVIWIPVASVDIERSFSQYKHIITLLARAVNNIIMYARGACYRVRDFESSYWMQRQLQSFQSVRALFGSQMDVERIQKGKVCC